MNKNEIITTNIHINHIIILQMYSNRLIYMIRSMSLSHMYKHANDVPIIRQGLFLKYVACISDEISNLFNIQQWRSSISTARNEQKLLELLKNKPIYWSQSDKLLHKNNLSNPKYVLDKEDHYILDFYLMQLDWPLTIDITCHAHYENIEQFNDRVKDMYSTR